MDNSVNSPRQKILRRKLKEARKGAQLTQKSLAEMLGKQQSYISKIELGERRVESMELESILSAMGLDAGAFIQELKTLLKESE